VEIVKQIARFILLVLLQVLVFNNYAFLGYMNPYIYLLFLLYLPTSISRSGLLIISFFLGLSIDLFENTGGIHASASLFIGFIRPYLLKAVSQRQGDDLSSFSIRDMALPNSLIYSASAIFIHHFIMFWLEEFSFKNFTVVLLRTIYSSIFTLVFVVLIQLWNFRRRE
tara:strand:+ start:50657 stop:51160 length:504 start_codon:yes stop_codon:yes gene_type:complete